MLGVCRAGSSGRREFYAREPRFRRLYVKSSFSLKTLGIDDLSRVPCVGEL